MSSDPIRSDQSTRQDLESNLSTDAGLSDPCSKPITRVPYRSDSGQYRLKDSSSYIPVVALVVLIGAGLAYVSVKSGMQYYMKHHAPVMQEQKTK